MDNHKPYMIIIILLVCFLDTKRETNVRAIKQAYTSGVVLAVFYLNFN